MYFSHSGWTFFSHLFLLQTTPGAPLNATWKALSSDPIDGVEEFPPRSAMRRSSKVKRPRSSATRKPWESHAEYPWGKLT